MDKSTVTLIVGLGNPILGDDGVGWKVVKIVEDIFNSKAYRANDLNLEFDYLSLGGLSLMERMDEYQDVIVVDSIITGTNPIGTIYSLPLHHLPNLSSGHSTAIHDMSLATAMQLGRKMGMNLPEKVWIVAVETESVFEFSEALSPTINQVVPEAAQLLLAIVRDQCRVGEISYPVVE